MDATDEIQTMIDHAITTQLQGFGAVRKVALNYFESTKETNTYFVKVLALRNTAANCIHVKIQTTVAGQGVYLGRDSENRAVRDTLVPF